ncbi:AfsR family transcriptional regulator [Trebonia kvetii]|uniref:AfsR family transcriptional regulator n=1 Tax=Trebonia kvetii TaxID=2480626 RepID=A0A6P2C6B9_9ACTN|nr:BTAD domain-containing putative transcriptional regulator [Trebonia kvetii]TVZ06055.1 AfsR family transcriptional regulator [Trebonia kvetii]
MRRGRLAVVPLRVGVLGPVTVWREGSEVAAGQPRQLAVLGVLASRANRVVSRGELVDAVWGDNTPASAEGGVYTYVAGLRRVLEPDRAPRARSRVLVSSSGGYTLRIGPSSLDASEFEECLIRARGLRAAGDAAEAASTLDAALSLWRGQPFTGVPGPFAEAERRRLTELRTAAVEVRANLMLDQGHAAAAIPELTALVAEHPLRERAHGLLMIALYQCGRQAEALGVFRDVRERLAEDLGIDPGVELTSIHQRLLAMDPALSGPAPADRTGARQADGASARPPTDQAPEAGPTTKPAKMPDGTPEQSPEAGRVAARQEADPGADAPSGPGGVPSPAQVPPEPAGFAGRVPELRWLEGLLPEQTGAEGTPIALITGTAGVGKTTLAIRFARQVASSFPDGQLYVNLRGFDPASAPVSPASALQWFFDALGVPPRHVPSALDAQSALLRSLLCGRRMMLLLDNAHDASQVRPLLPGSPGCMVIVTSRSQLTGLVVTEGAWPLSLDVLGADEAAELLAKRLGPERVTAEPHAVVELVAQSAGLPLALSVACARAVTRAGGRLADLAAELADARDRLDVLRTGEVTTDLRAVFSWSVDKLSEEAASAFRLIGLHPGPDISAAAAASLAGTTPAKARAALAELTRASLLTEDAAGRFGCHDLLRAYAAEQAAATLTDAERDLARRRILDHYLRTAQGAAVRLYPGRGLLVLSDQPDGVAAEEFDGDGAYDAALAWFTAENRVLHNVIKMAAAHGEDEHCWKLAWCWAPLLKRRGRLNAVLTVQRIALDAADRLGDTNALAHVHYDLGHVSLRLCAYAAAEAHLRRALELFTGIDDPVGIGQVRQGLGLLLHQQEKYAEALMHGLEALKLRRAYADRAAVAYSENLVGWIQAHLGQHEAALRRCRVALDLHRQSGSRTGAADTLDSIGYIHGKLGDHRQAVACYEQAHELYRVIGDSEGEARSLLYLGDIQIEAGETEAARGNWERALSLLAQIPGADTSGAAGRVSRLEPDAAACGGADTNAENVPESWNDRPRTGAVK